MRTVSLPHAAAAWEISPQIPVLEAGDLPGDEDWAVVESLRMDRLAAEPDPEADRFEEVQVARGAFD